VPQLLLPLLLRRRRLRRAAAAAGRALQGFRELGGGFALGGARFLGLALGHDQLVRQLLGLLG
jgi:hypothetical protein